MRVTPVSAPVAAPALRPLADVPCGHDVRIGQVTGTHVRRLAELGLRRGATVRVLTRSAGGGRTVAVGTTRFALDRRVLHDVEVAEVAEVAVT